MNLSDKNSILNTNSDIYPSTGRPGVRKLVTKESPLEILSTDYPRYNWPISGGWGYTIDQAVVIEVDNTPEGIAIEDQVIQFRSYEEAIVFQRPGSESRLAGLRFDKTAQSLCEHNGKTYDKIEVSITAFKETDFDFLKEDMESHNFYQNDPDGFERHCKLRDSKIIKYDVVC
ncbi:MAG: hypothetical protein ACI4TR_04165 [Bacteroidaceae bacterium]